MNEHPTPYTPPKRRSRVTVVKGTPAPPVTLSPLVKGMVTGTMGNVPLTSAVYAQVPRIDGPVDPPLVTVMFGDRLEVLGIVDGRVLRGYELDAADLEILPRLILKEGENR